MFLSISDFCKCQKGVVAIIFVVMLIPFLILAGVAINYSDANSKEAEMQQLIDSAVLAAASAKDITDEERVKLAERHFRAAISGKLAGLDKDVAFSVKNGDITGTVRAVVPAPTMGLFGLQDARLNQRAVATIKEEGRQLDMVFCIDASNSMQTTINTVRDKAIGLEQSLNDELLKRGYEKFAAVRVRVIFFRDYGFDHGDPRDSPRKPVIMGGDMTKQQAIMAGIPDPIFGASNQAPLRESKGGSFYTLPDESRAFRQFVAEENAGGGGDEPEDGFLCLNQAIHSEWAKPGNKLAGNKDREITTLIPLIVLWTDANAVPLEKHLDQLSERNPFYPYFSLPRNTAGLKANWDNPELIDQVHKLFVFFGNKNNDSRMCYSNSYQDESGAWVTPDAGPECMSRRRVDSVPRWRELDNWEKSEVGGTLTEANTQLVKRLADALAASPEMPRLTQ
jgi:Flp pilus assembly protein TadG